MDEIKGGITTMPCIQTKVSVKMTEQQEKTIKTELGKAISLIPGKSENWLMLTFRMVFTRKWLFIGDACLSTTYYPGAKGPFAGRFLFE